MTLCLLTISVYYASGTSIAKFPSSLCLLTISVYYASGTSIAKFPSSLCLLTISVYYASGTSIAKFPSSGTVITKTLKDQGMLPFIVLGKKIISNVLVLAASDLGLHCLITNFHFKLK